MLSRVFCPPPALRTALLQRITSQPPQWLQLAISHTALQRLQSTFSPISAELPPQRILPCPNVTLSNSRWQRGHATDTSSLPETMSFLRNLDNGAEIFLVGTAHVSSASAEEVRDVIKQVKPGTVMVELCAGRAEQMLRGNDQQQFNFLKSLMSKLGGGSQSFAEMIAGAGLQAMYRSLKYAGLDPGAEFKVAMQEAKAMNARLVYGDQDVNKTMSRISQHLGLQNLMRMLGAAIGGGSTLKSAVKDLDNEKLSLTDRVEAMKTRRSVTEMMEAMRQLNPGLVRALIDERDQVMVDNLAKLTGTVVGVVGLGHLNGMERLWAERARVAKPEAATH